MLRMIAVAIAIVAVTAKASPSASTPASRRAPVTPPSGWKAAPKLARAAASAAGTEATKVVASEAWSEPSIGCYAMWLRLDGVPALAGSRDATRGGGSGRASPVERGRKTPLSIDHAAHQIVAGLEKSGFTVRDVVAPAAPARRVIGLRFLKAPYQGLLRAAMAGTVETDSTSTDQGEAVDAVACAWNQREPSVCASACATLMEAVR